MKLVELIDFIRMRIHIFLRIFYAALVLVVIVDAIPIIVDKEHVHTSVEHLPGFWSIFGFISCYLVIYLSKWYGHAGIMQREDFYHE